MAKKIIGFLYVGMLAFSLAACGNVVRETQVIQPGQTESETMESIGIITETTIDESMDGESESATENETGRVLVAYFSWAENTVQNNVDAMTSASVRAPGNVAQFALWIAEETGGELFPIQVTELYPADWDSCLNRANKEKAENARPELERV